MKTQSKLLTLLVFISVLAGLSSSSVIVNSQDWRDNSLGIAYSHFTNEEVRMVTGLGEGKLIARVLGSNQTHSVYTSDDPTWNQYSQFLENKGVDTETNSINWSEDQYQLYDTVNEDVEGFIVVKPDFGADTISVFPKVVRDDYWPIYYQGERTQSFLKEEDKPVIFYGRYLDQPWLELDSTEKIISEGSAGENNKKLVQDLLQTGRDDSFVVAGESYLEKGFLKKGSPILLSEGLSGTVNIAEKYNISTIQVIGAENVNFGDSIKQQLGDQVSVIAKFGRRFTGIEGLRDTFPIKKLPVETVNRNVTLQKVELDSSPDSTDKIKLLFNNSGNVETEVNLSAIELINQQSPNQLISQFESINVRQGSSTPLVFETNVSSKPQEAEISFDYKGRSGLGTQDYEVAEADISGTEIEVKDLYYSTQSDMMALKVSNRGDAPAMVDAQLESVNILNKTLSVLPREKKRILKGDSARLIYDVRLNDAQLGENSNLNITLVSDGSTEQARNVELDVRDTRITGSFMSGVGATPLVLAVLTVLILFALAYKTGRPRVLMNE